MERESQDQDMRDRKTAYLHLFLLIATVFAVFGGSLRNGFIWDDHLFLTGNPVYRNFDLAGMFFSLSNGLEYLPVRDLTYALDFYLWGDAPLGFHVTNLVLYAVTAVIIHVLLLRLLPLIQEKRADGQDAENRRSFALLVSLLFVCHPLHAEVVCFVTQRNTLLSGLFFFLACNLYLRFMQDESGKIAAYAGSLACFVLSLLSKASGITLPLVLLLFAGLDVHRKREKRFLPIVPFVLLALFFHSVMTSVATQTRVIATTGEGMFVDLLPKMAVAIQIAAFYLEKLVFPAGLTVEYADQFSTSFSDGTTLRAAALCGVLAVAAVMTRRRYPEVLFTLLLYGICLIPVLNLYRTYPIVADRYVYIPGFAFMVALVAIPAHKYRRIYVLSAGFALVLIWSVLSVRQCRVWRSDVSLWEHATAAAPGLKAYRNLGFAYYNTNNYAKAEEMLRKVRTMDPLDENYDLFQGNMLLMSGEYAAAARSFEEGLAKKGDKGPVPGVSGWEIYYNAATAQRKAGNLSVAARYYEKSITLKPNHVDSHNSLGITFREMKQYDRAVRAFEKAISLDAGYELAPFNLAVTYLEMGDRAGAARYFALVRERFPRLREKADAVEQETGR